MAAEATTATRWATRQLATHGGEIVAVTGAEYEGEPVVVTAGDDGHIRFWSLADGTPRFSLSDGRAGGGPSKPTALAVAGDRLIVGWDDGGVSGVGLSGMEAVQFTPRHVPGASVTSLATFAPTPGDHRLASAATDGSVTLWQDTGTPAVSQQLRRKGKAAQSVAVTGDDGRHVVHVGTAAGRIEQWAVQPDGQVERLDRRIGLRVAPDAVVRLGVGRDETGRSSLLAAVGRFVNVFDPRTGHVTGQLPAHGDVISALHTTDDGTTAAVGADDGRLALLGFPRSRSEDQVLELSDQRISAIGSRGDSFVVGGAAGAVWVVEPAAPGAVVTVSDRVELQDDVPGETHRDDRLRRMPLAEALAVRLERRHQEGRERSFLVHLDGPWGSGKTTVLNFVADCLGPDWTIVRYNAWRQSRVGPQWWTLLTALRAEVVRRRSPLGRASLWFRELALQRIGRTSGWPATAFVVLAALAMFLLIRPDGTTASEVLTTFDGVAATGVAVATLFAGAQVVARFFGWHSPRGAKAFQDLDTNPMDRVAEHFSWLVRQERRPIALFVDDLDRCPAGDVVELLESVQTLVRDAGDERGEDHDVLSPCVVVAGDGAWIRNAFEEHYREFADQIAEPGRPLGYLFLAKIFQLTLPVPRIGPDRQAAFFRELLGLQDPLLDGADPVAGPAAVAAAEARVAAAPDDDAQQRVLADLPVPLREAVAPAAVRRQTEPAFAQATEHRLSGFAGLLPDNPRAVKRFLNAFALTRTVRTIEGQAIPTPTLALWAILQIRWPQLADALVAHPEWVDAGDGDPADPAVSPVPAVPAEVQELLDDPAVQAVLRFADGGPLTPDLIRACRGG